MFGNTGGRFSVKVHCYAQLMKKPRLDSRPRSAAIFRGALAAPLDLLESRLLLSLLFISFGSMGELPAAEMAGTSIIPHTIESSMRFRRPRDPNLAARVQLFVQDPARPTRFNGRTPAELLASNEWAWHDLGTAVQAPEGALMVWSFNGRSSRWGVGNSFDLEAEGLAKTSVRIATPEEWISAATFLSSDGSVEPDTIVLHLANTSKQELKVTSLRLWLPQAGTEWQVLWPQDSITVSATVPPGDKGFLKVRVPKLPLNLRRLGNRHQGRAALDASAHQTRSTRHQRRLGEQNGDPGTLSEAAPPSACECRADRPCCRLHGQPGALQLVSSQAFQPPLAARKMGHRRVAAQRSMRWNFSVNPSSAVASRWHLRRPSTNCCPIASVACPLPSP